ncbi:TPA: Fes/CIP4 y domain [Trebouxia sp. C0004]
MVKGRPAPTFGRDLKELCSTSKIPVFGDCISFLIKPTDGKKPAYCLEGLFKSASTDRKVNLLRQAYQLGRNPLRMLSLQDPFAVAGLLQAWLKELPEPLVRPQLFAQVIDSQKHQDEGERLLTLQAVLKQNDPYRLRILLPLLELLHHYCINQHSIQHAAEFIGVLIHVSKDASSAKPGKMSGSSRAKATYSNIALGCGTC